MHADPETQKVISEGAAFSRLLHNDDWKQAKKYLNEMFIQLDSWSTLPETFTPNQKLREMEHRQAAIALVQTWIAQIEGRADVGVETAKVMIDHSELAENFSYFPETNKPNA